MEILRGLLVAVEALLSFLLIAVILLQKSREVGMGLAFGQQFGETFLGSRAGNVLTRATVWLMSLFLANTVLLAMLFAGRAQRLSTGTRVGGAAPRPAATQPVRPESPAPMPGTVPTPAVPSQSMTVPVSLTSTTEAAAPTLTPAPTSSAPANSQPTPPTVAPSTPGSATPTAPAPENPK